MERYIRMLSFTTVFIVGGILHILLWKADYVDCFSQLFYGVMVLVWGLLVKNQIIERRIRITYWGIVGTMEVYFLLQICRYRLTDGNNRYLWYAYFIPMLVIPLLFLYLTLFINRQKEEPKRPLYRLLAVPTIVLAALIMTNDFHQLFMRLDDSLTDSIKTSTAGVLLYIYYAYSGGMLLAAFIILFNKCRVSISKRKILRLAIVVCICLFLWLSYETEIGPSVHGIKLWNVGEIYAICGIFILEACMQVGLITVNTSYTRIFQETDLPAVIRDITGRDVYRTKGAEAVFSPSEETLVRKSDISGGSVTWAVDLSAVNTLNRQIAETIGQINARNHYLTTQNAMKEEKAAIDARNRVYDRIARIVSSQLTQIEKLLADSETDFTKRLKKIVVYNAYIKRRSNLELLRESEDKISAAEIYTAIAESVNYLELNQINVSVNFLIDGEISVDAAVLVYDFFETVAEYVLNKISMLSVTVAERSGIISIRMLTDIPDCSFIDNWSSRELVACHGKIVKTENNQDSILALSFERGGDRL